jgi:hypothetical protein
MNGESSPENTENVDEWRDVQSRLFTFGCGVAWFKIGREQVARA